MAYLINDDCTNCGACEPECPNSAVYEGDVFWKFSEGTALKGKEVTHYGKEIDADLANSPIEKDKFYIVKDKCTDCIGFSKEPQCVAVCPMDAIQLASDETDFQQRKKATWLHKSDPAYNSCPLPISSYAPKSCCHSSNSDEIQKITRKDSFSLKEKILQFFK